MSIKDRLWTSGYISFIKKTVKKKRRYGHGSFTFQYLLIVLQTTCHPLGEQVYGYIINKIEYSKRNRIDFSEERKGKIHGKMYEIITWLNN